MAAGVVCVPALFSDRAKVGTPRTARSIEWGPAPALSQCPARGQRSSTGSDSGTGSARDTTPACLHTAPSVRVQDAAGACALVRADVAQLVEHHLAKVRVAGSNPVVRSGAPTASTGPRSVGRPWFAGGVAEWLRQGPAKPCTRVRFPPPPRRRHPSVGVAARLGSQLNVNGSTRRAFSSAGEHFPDTE